MQLPPSWKLRASVAAFRRKNSYCHRSRDLRETAEMLARRVRPRGRSCARIDSSGARLLALPMTEVAPTAQGSLEATPLGHLLVYSLDRMLTGTLVLEESSGNRHAIYFDEGGPSKAKIQDPVLFWAGFGRAKGDQRRGIRAHLGPSDRARSTARSSPAGARHIDEHALREGLREQLSRQVLWMFGLPKDTLFGYYDRLNFLGAGEARACEPSPSP